jgi:hypothetical protein
MARLFLISLAVYSLFCSELDIGTDILKLGNIVSSGKVQSSWTYSSVSYITPVSQSIIFFYLKGFDSFGPKFEIESFHHEDENLPTDSQKLSMSVSLDEEINGILKDYRAIKVTQECLPGSGSASLILNLTLKAHSCEAITFNWVKLCGEPSEYRTGLHMGLSLNSSDVVEDGAVTSMFDSDLNKAVYTVPSSQNFITFFMYLRGEPVRTYFKSPYLLADHEVIFPELTGSMTKATWIEGNFLELRIEFNCLVLSGIHEDVELVVELPYFKNLQIFFFKDCGNKTLNSKVFGILLLAFGLVIVLAIMWMHINGDGEKVNYFCQWGKSRAWRAVVGVWVFLMMKYRILASKYGFAKKDREIYGSFEDV